MITYPSYSLVYQHQTQFTTPGTVRVVPSIPILPIQNHGNKKLRSLNMARFPSGNVDHTREALIMTPVTASVHHPVMSSPPAATVSYSPFLGAYQTPSNVQGYQNYIPLGSPTGNRLPAVESYSAMLASMGSQLQLAQAQGHAVSSSYLPGGYIALSGQYPQMHPVLIPTTQLTNREGAIQTLSVSEPHIPQGAPVLRYPSQEHRLPLDIHHRTQEIPSERKEIPDHHSDTRRLMVRTGDIHGIRPGVIHEQIYSRSADTSQTLHKQIASLDAILGKTSNPQPVASAPGGIRIELPPPTIGMHIGTKPPQLAPHTAIVPPLLPSPHRNIEHGAKLVPSSSSAPLPSYGCPSSRPLSSQTHSSGPHHMPPQILPSLFESRAAVNTGQVLRHIQPSSSGHGTPLNQVSLSLSSHSYQQALCIQEHETKEVLTEKQSKEQTPPHVHQTTQAESDANDPQVQSSRPILTSQPPPVANVPSYFTRGSIIQLASGHLKRVEELQTEDFMNSAQLTDGLKIDSSTVSRIEKDQERGVALISFLVGTHKAQVTVEARLDHPFFVYGQGWSSVCPPHSQKCYSLNCHTLSVGDVCVSLTVIERKDSQKTADIQDKYVTVGPSASTSHNTEAPTDPLHSPQRKRQRFHELRMSSFDESMESTTVKAEHQKSDLLMRTRMKPEQDIEQTQREYVKDQNQNVISEAGPGTPPRWIQPPKRRWSDPIKSPEDNMERDKEILPNAPHPTTLSKLTEEH